MPAVTEFPFNLLSNLNGRSKILHENLFQSATTLKLVRNFTFQQDDGLEHKAKAIAGVVKNKGECFTVPSQSQDLNPIENLWHGLKIAVKHPTNMSNLEQICQEECVIITAKQHAKLVGSVSAAKGGSIKNESEEVEYLCKQHILALNVLSICWQINDLKECIDLQ